MDGTTADRQMSDTTPTITVEHLIPQLPENEGQPRLVDVFNDQGRIKWSGMAVLQQRR